MALSYIKNTFTNCFIRRKKPSKDYLVNHTDENENTKKIYGRNCDKTGSKNKASETKIIHNIPSSIIQVTKEERELLYYVVVTNALWDVNMI